MDSENEARKVFGSGWIGKAILKHSLSLASRPLGKEWLEDIVQIACGKGPSPGLSSKYHFLHFDPSHGDKDNELSKPGKDRVTGNQGRWTQAWTIPSGPHAECELVAWAQVQPTDHSPGH